MKKYKISEIFFALQGEGSTIGKPSIFVRYFGCHLANRGKPCPWCDSKYAWNQKLGSYSKLSGDEIIREIKKYDCKHIVITGGEPYLQLETSIDWLWIMDLWKQGYTFEVETTGDYNLRSYPAISQYNISPKIQQSMIDFDDKIVYAPIILKFVYEPGKKNIEGFIFQVVNNNPGIKNIYIMPQCKNRKEYLLNCGATEKFCMENNFIFSPRLHIINWDGERGK